jgi:hypothetical protein
MINLIENSTPVHADHVTGTGLVRVCHVSILSLILFAISSPMQGNISIFFILILVVLLFVMLFFLAD